MSIHGSYISVALTGCVVAVGSTIVLLATSVLDQANDPRPAPYAIGLGIRDTVFYRGQSFTAGASGVLTRVELFVNRDITNGGDLLIAVRAGTDVSNPVLAAGTIHAPDIPTGNLSDGTGAGFAGADLSSSNLQVEAGDVYTIWATSASGTDEFGWWGNAGVYIGGNALTLSTKGVMFLAAEDLGFRTYVGSGARTLQCDGFKPPLDAGPVSIKKSRVLPHRAVLRDGEQIVSDAQLSAPPIMQVLFTPEGTQNALDVSAFAETAGAATTGNQFVYSAPEWHYNLEVKSYTAKGTYRSSIVSGDPTTYSISGCNASFVIR
ncbi:MAG TPA: hypothetical protein VM166_10530 [Gemmatimonadaceae bacterium]|nr:hypothetical protein [Gemmatimonadaceae bacterium]